MAKYRRYEDLKANAEVFWPSALAEKEQTISVIPRLIETQDKFIAVLHVADTDPRAWQTVLKTTSGLAPNLFLKHLMVLSDVSGEKLQRFKSQLLRNFPGGKMTFVWQNNDYTHELASLHGRSRRDNKSLKLDGASVLKPFDWNPSMFDAAMLILFGGSSTNAGVPAEIQEKCGIGGLLGDKRRLDTYVRQRYIWVSRITGGAAANKMGHLAQSFVKEKLCSLLPDWDFSRRSIRRISQNAGRTDIKFDIVAESPKTRFWAIEVSFQVTTNSTIERKSGQAAARQKLLHKMGHRIGYVIDGAGNFERKSALETICAHSDFTCTFADRELALLAEAMAEQE